MGTVHVFLFNNENIQTKPLKKGGTNPRMCVCVCESVFMFHHIRSPAENNNKQQTSWQVTVSPAPVHPPGPEDL